MKKTTASIALVALTSGLFVNGVSAASTSEVQAAEKLAAEGIVVKQANVADYQLDRQVLRQEIAALARGVAKLEKAETCTNIFNDVSATKPNTWACYTVEALANNGLIAKNPSFRPEANITKAEAVGMIVKARFGNEYSPVSGAGEWQKQVVDFAVSKGIATQFSNYNTPATRGFVFEVAAKALENGTTDPICELLGVCPGKDDQKQPEKPVVPTNSGTLMVSSSAQNPSNGMVAVQSPRAVLLAFDVTAGKEDVTLKKALLKFTGTGNEGSVSDLSIYANDIKITRNSGTFNSKLESTLSFDRDAVIKAGETKTLFVTANIDPKGASYNQMLRVSLENLEASATVTWAKITGATLTPYLVSNKASLTADSSYVGGKLYIGKEDLIYTFNLRETSKKEDTTVKTITFEKTDKNTADLENLSNLSLTLDGKKVNATFTYQKDKIIATLNETIKSGQRVTFALRWEMIDDLNDKLGLEVISGGIYAVGNTTGTSSTVVGTLNPTLKEITGSSVNFSFSREGSNEVSKNTDDVKVGELVFVTNTDYTANIRVAVKRDENNKISDLELDSLRTNAKEFTLKSNGKLDKATESEIEAKTFTHYVYDFTNVSLVKGSNKLPLTIDVKDNASDWSINFTASVEKLEDETLNESVKLTVLNNNNLTKTVRVVESGLKIVDKGVITTRVTPKNNPEVVLYKGFINVNGSEDITIDNMSFDVTTTNLPTDTNLDNVLSGVTLNIGGKTFSGNVSGNKILFNSVFATIEKGAKNVEFLVTSVLSDRELKNGNEKIKVTKLAADLSAAKSTPTDIKDQGTDSTEVVLEPKTLLEVVSNTGRDSTIVAGLKNAEIGTFKLKSTSTDIYVNELTVDYLKTEEKATKLESVNNIRLMNGSDVLAVGIFWSENINKTEFKYDSGKDKDVKTTVDTTSKNVGSVLSTEVVYSNWEITVVETVVKNQGAVDTWINTLRTYTKKATGAVLNTNKDLERYFIEFKNFNLPTLSKTTTLSVVADIPAITNNGGLDKTFIWDVKLTAINLKSDDASITNADSYSKKVTVEPAKITLSSSDRFGNKDEIATVKVVVSKDNASEFTSSLLTEINLGENSSKILTIRLNGKDITEATWDVEQGKFKVENWKIKLKEDISDLYEFTLEFVSKSNPKVTDSILSWLKVELWNYEASSATDNTITLGSYSN